MDSKLLEVMVMTIMALLILWLVARLCFRVFKTLAAKGPDFIKYLIIVFGVLALVWAYYNPEKAKSIYMQTKSRLFGGAALPAPKDEILVL